MDPTQINSVQGLTQFNNRNAFFAKRRSKQELAEQTSLFVNWDYTNWRPIWRAIRHAMIGEVEIKKHAHEYLPKPEGMDDDQYAAYLDRAVFYNMVYRTVTGLTGAIFRREPRLIKAGPKLTKLTKRISKDGLSLNVLAKVIAQEIISVGRYGLLADKADSNDIRVQPYLAGYTCENVLDWTTTVIDGRDEYNYILLREFIVDRRMFVFEGPQGVPNKKYGQLFITYRILRLTENLDTGRFEYTQEYYQRPDADATMMEVPVITKPLIYGVPMERIPFRFFNATTNGCDIEKSPILDILTLNLSHYKTYAQLEHGRFYTANPVYWVSGSGEEDEYNIGPSVVWEIGTNEKAGLIEFNGTGLKSLETALETKETQVASLGGRLIGDAGSSGQSDNQIKLKDRNEQSLLLNVTTVLNENITDLLVVIAQWMNENADELKFRVNQDFLLEAGAAREFRAITLMYQQGILPIEIIYEYFLKAEVIPEYVTQEMFINMLEDAKQFPNNPDFAARQDGFPDAKTQHNIEMEEAALEEEAREFDEEHSLATKTQADASKAALAAAKAPKVVAPAPGNPKPPAPGQPKAPTDATPIAPVPAGAKQAMKKGV